MDFEQILIRLGLDAKAVTAGLTRVTSFVKGWATGLVHDLQHHVIGRLAGLVIFERLFDGIKEKALFVQRTAKETGLSTNMIQGMANELGYVGEGFEGMAKPLGKFNELIGKAKMGSIEARTKLMDLGIVSKGEEINTLNLSKGLAAAAKQFDSIKDAAVRAARMEEMFGKSWEKLMPIFELGQKRIEALDKGNFFTKISPAALEHFSELFRSGKDVGNVATSVAANLANASLTPIINAVKVIGDGASFLSGRLSGIVKGPQQDMLNKSKEIQETEKETAHETTEAYLQRVKLQEEGLRLENQLADRAKSTIDQLAEKGFRMLGRRAPKALENIHAITPAIANAMQVKTLQVAAADANVRGQFDRSKELLSRADQLAGSNMALKSTEREPMREVAAKLEEVRVLLDKVDKAGILVRGTNH